MPDIVAGSGAGAFPPGLPSGQQTGTANPVMTTNFDKTLTALVRREILTNLREVTRWLVPGAYITGKLIQGTNLIRHIAYGDLPVQASLIAVEGVPPADEALTIGYTEYSVQQRGRVVGVTDVAMALSPHELMSVAAERIANDAKQTVDISIADAVKAGAGINLGTLTTAAAIAAIDIRKFVVKLKAAHVPTFPDGFYIAMVHPNVVFDLQSDTSIGGWIEASKYADPSRLLNGEIGRMFGVRFIETTTGTWTGAAGAGNDQYTTVIFGPDYFAFGDLQSVQSYTVRPGGDHSDPLAQKGLVGYKGMWGAKTLEVAQAGGPRFGKISHLSSIEITP